MFIVYGQVVKKRAVRKCVIHLGMNILGHRQAVSREVSAKSAPRSLCCPASPPRRELRVLRAQLEGLLKP